MVDWLRETVLAEGNIGPADIEALRCQRRRPRGARASSRTSSTAGRARHDRPRRPPRREISTERDRFYEHGDRAAAARRRGTASRASARTRRCVELSRRPRRAARRRGAAPACSTSRCWCRTAGARPRRATASSPPAAASTAPPTTTSARPSTCATPRATGSRSTATARASEWGLRPGRRAAHGTEALDLGALMRELPGDGDSGMPDGTRIGHVHLQVADIGAARRRSTPADLGLDVTVRSYPGALFLSRDGYHHHVGANAWAGTGLPAPPAGSRGLEWFEMTLPGVAEGLVSDPSGNRVLLRAGLAEGFVDPLAVAAAERELLLAAAEDRLVLVGALAIEDLDELEAGRARRRARRRRCVRAASSSVSRSQPRSCAAAVARSRLTCSRWASNAGRERRELAHAGVRAADRQQREHDDDDDQPGRHEAAITARRCATPSATRPCA